MRQGEPVESIQSPRGHPDVGRTLKDQNDLKYTKRTEFRTLHPDHEPGSQYRRLYADTF